MISTRSHLAAACLGAVALVAMPLPAGPALKQGATIEYIGHAAFRIHSSAGASVLIDPFASRTWIGYDFPPGIDADAVLITHPHYDHDAGMYRGGEPPWSATTTVHRDPGSYAVGDIQITGVQGKHADPYGREFGQINTIWLVEIDGLRIVHTGDNGPISSEIARQLGRVDVLLAPIDAEFHIISQETIEQYQRLLQPRILVPMHYRIDELETDSNGPADLGNVDDWAATQTGVSRVHSHLLGLDSQSLPAEPIIVVLDHSPMLTAPRAPPNLAITNVTVIDSVRGQRDNVNVVVADQRILSVTTGSVDPEIPAIDGTGKYLIPGLWDAHVHFDFDPALAPAMFNLFLANGVTSVRDTGGQLDAVRPWKRYAMSGEVPAPRVMIAGPLLDGSPRVYDGNSPFRPNLGADVASVEDAVAQVDALAAAGVDLIKAYELLSPEVFEAIVSRAREHGLPVTGHPPLSMHAADTADGFDSIEHLRNLDLACSSEADDLLAERRRLIAAGWDNGGDLRGSIHAAQRPRAIGSLSDQACDDLVAALKDGNAWQVPTLTIVMPRMNRLHARAEWRANFAYLPNPVRDQWLAGAEAMAGETPAEPTIRHGRWAQSMVKRLADAGVPIMAGTDTPIFFLTPGFSLHEELVNLVDAGLSTAEALATATLRPAQYFDLEDQLGSLGPGMLADLVLLDANPLTDIRHTQRIRAVVRNGELFDRAALDELLARAATTGRQSADR